MCLQRLAASTQPAGWAHRPNRAAFADGLMSAPAGENDFHERENRWRRDDGRKCTGKRARKLGLCLWHQAGEGMAVEGFKGERGKGGSLRPSETLLSAFGLLSTY